MYVFIKIQKIKDFLVTLDGWEVEHFLPFDFGAGKGQEKWKKNLLHPTTLLGDCG